MLWPVYGIGLNFISFDFGFYVAFTAMCAEFKVGFD